MQYLEVLSEINEEEIKVSVDQNEYQDMSYNIECIPQHLFCTEAILKI